MPRFVQIDAALINIETIDRIDDALNPDGCTVVVGNARFAVKETVDQVIKKLAQAEVGELPRLTAAEVTPQIY
jgi:uncharacterized protein YlzI (FlbEa/FlbD family)